MNVGFQFPKGFLRALVVAALSAATLCAVESGATPSSLSQAQQAFRGDLAARFQALDKKGTGATAGVDGWLFLASELRFLSLDCFWGGEAPRANRAAKPDVADPIPAILDFHQQLKARGIDLLLVPVPPKAAIYPDKIVPNFPGTGEDAAPALHRFYEELRAQGLDVLDLAPLLLANRDHERGPVFCATDTHWSGMGCTLAAQAIAEKIRAKVSGIGTAKAYVSEWKEVGIEGDLVSLIKPQAPKSGPEKIRVRSVAEQTTGAPVTADENSPVLLLGDSHTLVFHDFLAERAGLLDQLAVELGFAPDLIGTRGSGATPVRISLYRRSVKDSGVLSRKKVVVWCFTAREFAEAAQGWAKVPVAK